MMEMLIFLTGIFDYWFEKFIVIFSMLMIYRVVSSLQLVIKPKEIK